MLASFQVIAAAEASLTLIRRRSIQCCCGRALNIPPSSHLMPTGHCSSLSISTTWLSGGKGIGLDAEIDLFADRKIGKDILHVRACVRRVGSTIDTRKKKQKAGGNEKRTSNATHASLLPSPSPSDCGRAGPPQSGEATPHVPHPKSLMHLRELRAG